MADQRTLVNHTLGEDQNALVVANLFSKQKMFELFLVWTNKLRNFFKALLHIQILG